MVGASLVSTPVEHQHIALAAVAGHELPRDLPCFRDPDYLVYGKSEAGGGGLWAGGAGPGSDERDPPLVEGVTRNGV